MFNNSQIATIKFMLARGDKQHDIAAHFKCNQGRIAEVAKGTVGAGVKPATSMQAPKRYFTPEMSLDEQVEVFDSLSKEGPFDTARAHYISPELAEYLLQHNTKNRPKRAANIQRWADAMEAGEWGLTGETLIFSKPPVRLLDGQHRLAAAVKAGVGFKSFIVFGIDRGEFTKIDTGAGKGNGDALAFLGVKDPSCVAAALRWNHLLGTNPHDRTTLSNEFIVDAWKAIDKNKESVTLLDLCAAARRITKTHRKNGSSVFTPGQLAGVLFKLHNVDEKATTKFIAALENNKGNAKALTTRLDKIREFGRINDVGRAGMIVKAWEATCDGATITVKAVNYDPSTEDFPLFGNAGATPKIKLVA